MSGHASITAVTGRLVEPGPGRRGFALVAGLVVVAVLVYADVVAADQDIVIGTVVVGPLLCSVWGRPRDVAFVGAVATACAVLSAAWNQNITAATFVLRAVVVAFGSVVAVLASTRRETIARDRLRFALLSAIAEVGTGTQTLEATAARVTELIVPAAADLCTIDVITGGKPRRLAVRAHGGGSRADAEAALAAAPPAVSEPLRSGSVTSTAVQLTPNIAGRRPREGPSRESDPTLARALRVRSTVVVPLVARGRTLGALTMSTTADSGRAYETEDETFAQVLAGRVALALDNAGLFAELGTIEAQLSAALSGLPEAVTIQSPPGALVYANDAAARLMGFTSPRELVAASVEEIIERFAPTRDDGRAIAPDEFPGRRVLAGQAAEPMVSRSIDRATGEERWLLTKATPVRDREGGLALVVNVIEDITEVKRAERDQRLLAEAGEILSGSSDHESMVQRVAELVVGVLADGCAIRLPDGRGRMRTVAVAHRDPTRASMVRALAERDGDDLTAPGTAPGVVDAEPATARTDRVTTLPMLAAGRPVGLLNLINTDARRRLTAADRALAEELATRAAAAVEHNRLHAERSRIARTLQAGLLPDALPAMPGWEVRSLYRPVEGDENLVGGDFFDAIPVRDGWLTVVGDVTGHGAAAAPLTALARHTLRATAKLLSDPLQAIDRLNDELVERATSSFCSVGAAHLREHDGHAHVDLVCAGHPPALLIEAGEARALGCHGPLLGAVPSPRWERVGADLPAGAILVLYTDGVLDATGRDRERFGEQRLARTLAGATNAQDAITRIDRALRAFQVGRQADDTAVLTIERLP